MDLSYIANEIKNRIDTRDVFEFYGLKPNNKGFICCPFHNEKTASMKIYEGNRGYHCFGCSEHGGIIDFVIKYFDLSFKDALKKINEDFLLNLPIDCEIDYNKKIEIAKASFKLKKEREKKEKEKQNLQEQYYLALDKWVILEKQKREYSPKNENMCLHPLFVNAIINLPHAEHNLECAEMELYLYEKRND